MTGESHELRDLRWKYKNVCKQNGAQAEKIYQLRCQLAEARGLFTVDPTYQRRLQDEVVLVVEKNFELEARVAELTAENEALRRPHKLDLESML